MITSPSHIQAILDIYHPHICLFLDVCQVFICFKFSIYNFIDIETYFSTWNTYRIGTYREISKTRVIYIEDYLCFRLSPQLKNKNLVILYIFFQFVYLGICQLRKSCLILLSKIFFHCNVRKHFIDIKLILHLLKGEWR